MTAASTRARCGSDEDYQPSVLPTDSAEDPDGGALRCLLGTSTRPAGCRAPAAPVEVHSRHGITAEPIHLPLLIIDDLGVRKLPDTAAEDLLALILVECAKWTALG